jgi:hypothetical protein
LINEGVPPLLGRRDPQRSLFEAQAWPHRVPAESFYARMGVVNDGLFRDDDLAGLYCADNGRPSLPPSLLSGILLLQLYDDVSDGEAIDQLQFDLRWRTSPPPPPGSPPWNYPPSRNVAPKCSTCCPPFA